MSSSSAGGSHHWVSDGPELDMVGFDCLQYILIYLSCALGLLVINTYHSCILIELCVVLETAQCCFMDRNMFDEHQLHSD